MVVDAAPNGWSLLLSLLNVVTTDNFSFGVPFNYALLLWLVVLISD